MPTKQFNVSKKHRVKSNELLHKKRVASSILLVTTSRNRLGLWSLGGGRRLGSLDALLSWSRDISGLLVTLGVLIVDFTLGFLLLLFLFFFLSVAIRSIFGGRLGRLALLYRGLD